MTVVYDTGPATGEAAPTPAVDDSSASLPPLAVWEEAARSQRFEQFLLACEADARGRLGLEDNPYPQAVRFRMAYQAATAVATASLLEQGLRGEALGEAIRRARLQAIAAAVRQQPEQGEA